MKVIQNFDIIPVIGLPAANFIINKYPLPNGSAKEMPDKWHQLWVRWMLDNGIENLDTIKPGHNFVRLSKIDDQNLSSILDKIILNEDDWEFDSILPLDGGIIIFHKNEILIEPQCCSDISNCKNWRYVLENKPEKWLVLWIGHPWVLLRIKDNKFEFSNYVENSDYESIRDLDIAFSLDLAVFKKQFENVIFEIENFKSKVLSVLTKKNVKDAEIISKTLVWGTE